MNKLIIKKHDFEKAKRGLKEFSQKKVDELKIDTVRTNGGFLGLGNHKVTGYEFNSRMSTIQEHLIDLNTMNNRTVKEFGQVYSALEALDKDYIQAILISIKATEKTSESIQATQEKIKKIVDDQKKTLEVLKKFKQKLDGYAHLGDIDKIWSDCQKWYNEIATLSNSISCMMASSKSNSQKVEDLKRVSNSTEMKLDDLSKQFNQQIIKLKAIIDFTSELEKIVHLQDIDEMWDSLSNVHISLTNISNKLSSFKDTASKQQSDIEILLSFMKNLSGCKHLNDIDDIWSKSEEHDLCLANVIKTSEEIQNSLSSNAKNIEELQKYKNYLGQMKHLDDVDNIWETTESHSVNLEELKQQDENTLELVEANKISIDELREYKSKLCSITHLKDVDDIWTKSEEHHRCLASLVKTSEGIKNSLSSNAKNIEELQKYKNYLGQIKHLDDVDSIWETTESHSVNLEELKQQDENILELVETNKISIGELREYKSKLCNITHLKDVDDIWSSNKLHSSQLSELEKQKDEIKSIIQTIKENTDAAIASVVEKNDTAVQMLTKKIKYAYLIAGGTLGIAIIELIVILLKVI
ncbi:MAG: hypothetical protein E7D69_16875 [Clostridium celatum]|nr:hypothetical protein [Clostridium celatum]